MPDVTDELGQPGEHLQDVTADAEKPTDIPGLGGSSRIALIAGLGFFLAFTLFASLSLIHI